MFKTSYKRMYDQITPNEQLVSSVCKRVSSKERTAVQQFFKPLTAGIALTLCIFVSIPVLAANVPTVYQMLYSVYPAAAQLFKPVRVSCEDEGIKMEVLSAYIHSDTAEIYILFKDMTGDRLDGSVDLFDSYSIHRPFDSSASCRLVSFDGESRTATFLISMTEWGKRDITGDKITFSVRKLLYGKRVYDDFQVTADLSGVSGSVTTMPMPQNGGGGNYVEYFNDNNYIPNVIIPTAPEGFGIDGIDISGFGYADGMLHVQTVVRDHLNNDNHGYFFFKDSAGNEIQSVYGVAFILYENGERLFYNEQVFDISESALKDYKMYGYFVTGGDVINGNWQVTFPLKAAE